MIVSITITRNSAWVLRATIETALAYCDAAAILDHASTDRTAEVIADLAQRFPGRVSSVREPDPTWREMDHRQRVLELARAAGGTIFANIDDDEVLTYNLHAAAREKMLKLHSGEVLMSPIMCVWDGLSSYRDDDSEWSRGSTYLAFANAPGMTFKPARDGYQFHNRRPSGSRGPAVSLTDGAPHRGGVLHLQFASRRRLRAKQALYKMTETVCWPGRRTAQQLNEMYDNTTLNLPRAQRSFDPGWLLLEVAAMVDVDAEPWQEAECRRLWVEHGAEKFKDLDLYGVVV